MKTSIFCLIAAIITMNSYAQEINYQIVDTGQEKFFNNMREISGTEPGEAFYGQDAHHMGNQPDYTDNGNGTITDNVTMLMWQKSPDFNNDGEINSFDKKTHAEALAAADTFSLGGYDDWRLPSIKELYTLFMAYGTDPSGPDFSGSIPFIDTSYFEFGFGDEANGERIIDAQFAATTVYVGTVFGSEKAMFGVNFADGRIKGYPKDVQQHTGEAVDFYVLYVRGNPDYGKNNLKDNGDGTITDKATGLMWSKDDSGEGMIWADALAWAQQKNNEEYLGYTDWRLPNVKELQSIVDYERSPSTTNSAAIDPVFNCTEISDEGGNPNYPFYWTSTTHISSGAVAGSAAMYLCFGEALGFMEMPPNSGNVNLMDVHGAGAQRSDFKTGDPGDYPQGHGPQGDVVRIYNFVRLVRDAGPVSGMQETGKLDNGIEIYPNPATNYIFVKHSLGFEHAKVSEIQIYSALGELALAETDVNSVSKINVSELPAGVYHLRINSKMLKFIKM